VSDATPSPLDEALDADRDEGVPADVQGDGWRARIHTRQVGPIGVVVDRLRVQGSKGDIAGRAEALADGLHPLGEPLDAVEVAPELGGAVLRTAPDRMRGGRFFEVDVGEDSVDVRRLRRKPEGGRVEEGFAVTRDELGRIVDDIVDVLRPPEPDD